MYNRYSQGEIMLETLKKIDKLLKSIGNPELEEELGDQIIILLDEAGAKEQLRELFHVEHEQGE